MDENLVGGQYVGGTPLLVVEIHSPAKKMLDLTGKRSVYARAHIPCYWLMDPDASTLTVLELQEGGYRQVAVVGANDAWPVDHPFAMTLEGSKIFE